MAERLVVIGGDAAGMTAATNARRGRTDLDIVVLEKGHATSYSACGIPYVVGGSVGALDDLVVRTPQEFRDQHRIDARTRHEVTAIDLDARTVEVRALDQARTYSMGFDLLHLATGARPRRPDLPGIHEPWIRGVQTLDDAAALLAAVDAHQCRRVVVVGGGYIGLEMAEAFTDRGSKVTLVEGRPYPLGSVDADVGARITEILRGYGVTVHLGVRATGFEPGTVHTTIGDQDADLVVLGLGVEPSADLAEAAGIRRGVAGAIEVDHRQRTSADGVYAAGDCADTFHLVSRERVHIALGTVANKTGRVAGVNLGGGYASFPGVLGTAVTRVCAVEIARTGLSSTEADRAGFEYLVGTAQATSRAGYVDDTQPVLAKVLVERGTGRIIGGQVVGADRVGKRIDTVATAITAGMTADEFGFLDLAYAPSVSPLWDVFQLALRNLE
jgi:NADPH-dependent 2,4-dienoyl-CoA reductase/sulfur reductase-like enzyme